MNILNAIPPFAIAAVMAALLILLVYLVVSSVRKKQAEAKAEDAAKARRAAQPPRLQPLAVDDVFPRLGSRPPVRDFVPISKPVPAAKFKTETVPANPKVGMAKRGERLVAMVTPEDTTTSIFAAETEVTELFRNTSPMAAETAREAPEAFIHSHAVTMKPYEGPEPHSHKVPDVREIEEPAVSRAQDEPRHVPPTAPDDEDHRPNWDDDSSSSSSSNDD